MDHTEPRPATPRTRRRPGRATRPGTPASAGSLTFGGGPGRRPGRWSSCAMLRALPAVRGRVAAERPGRQADRAGEPLPAAAGRSAADEDAALGGYGWVDRKAGRRPDPDRPGDRPGGREGRAARQGPEDRARDEQPRRDARPTGRPRRARTTMNRRPSAAGSEAMNDDARPPSAGRVLAASLASLIRGRPATPAPTPRPTSDMAPAAVQGGRVRPEPRRAAPAGRCRSATRRAGRSGSATTSASGR